MNSIIVGLGWGDEGKGLTTSFLCSKAKKPLVVRFNGGHQAGHTVVYKDKRHIFSSFGAGTLQGAPTYWSRFCTFYPPAFLREKEVLGFNPVIFVDPLCPVTTPFDVDFNQAAEKVKSFGSVGVGFGATIQRQEAYFKLFAQDLFHPVVLHQKLWAIAEYYNVPKLAPAHEKIEWFKECAAETVKHIQLQDQGIVSMIKWQPIFEGAQGILLDMDFGFFPNVTRSNTTCKNAHALMPDTYDEIYYVTRSYSTRHGNGFFPVEEHVTLINNEYETNRKHDFQGEFKTATLNVDLLKYALDCDNNFSGFSAKNLVITCMDQNHIDVNELLSKLPYSFNNVYISRGPSLDHLSIFKR